MTDLFVLPPVDEDLGMTGLARAALAHGIADAESDPAGHGPHSVRLIVRNARALAVAEDHTDPDLLERIVITAALQNLADPKRTGDPEARQYPRTKRGDDATAILIDFTEEAPGDGSV
ncbi:hypothetical protein [Glycomyces sp. NPDC047010]|uniref:hypothetical protein n=1 Tax=Glycomyces sp. NPDC047010 TaxID=3155023 RepID=UPI0033ECBB2F